MTRHTSSHQIPELVARLVDRSLVNYDDSGRYCMLHTIRLYAGNLLSECEEEEEVRSRFFRYYFEFCRETEAKIRGPEQLVWLKRYDEEADNFRLALELGTLSATLWGLAVEMATELLDYWIIRARLAEAYSRFEQLVQQAPEDDIEHCALALSGLASCMRYREKSGYTEVHIAALKKAREADRPGTLARVIFSYGYTLHHQEKLAEAENLFLEVLSIVAGSDSFLEAFTLLDLGHIAQAQGELERAEGYYRRVLAIRERQGDLRGVGAVLGALGQVADLRGDFEAAAVLNKKFIRTLTLVGDALGLASGLAAGCCGLWLENRHEEAAMLLGCADQALEELSTWRDPTEQEERDRWSARLLESVGEEVFERAYDRGRGLTVQQGVNLVLSETAPSTSGSNNF
jgi:tetratricopeptide (TPR) repeat protein